MVAKNDGSGLARIDLRKEKDRFRLWTFCDYETVVFTKTHGEDELEGEEWEAKIRGELFTLKWDKEAKEYYYINPSGVRHVATQVQLKGGRFVPKIKTGIQHSSSHKVPLSDDSRTPSLEKEPRSK